MKEITDELRIEAPVERVWSLTTDVEGWPATTPTITSVERLDEGAIGVGSTARVTQPYQRPAVWTVTRFEPDRLFEWQTKVGTVTLTGRHELTPVGGTDGTPEATVNRLTLAMSGVGHRLARVLVGRSIAKAIATENQGFKRAAEGTLTRS
jgi:uncharacterized membrane protein